MALIRPGRRPSIGESGGRFMDGLKATVGW